jgi:hypothetical protein
MRNLLKQHRVGLIAVLAMLGPTLTVASPAPASDNTGPTRSVSVPRPAIAAEGVAPQAICEDTGWRASGPWIGESDSPWYPYATNSSIQFRILSGTVYRRTYRDCSRSTVYAGQAQRYRIRNGSVNNSWRNVTRSCTVNNLTLHYGYNYGAGSCYTWSARIVRS